MFLADLPPIQIETAAIIAGAGVVAGGLVKAGSAIAAAIRGGFDGLRPLIQDNRDVLAVVKDRLDWPADRPWPTARPTPSANGAATGAVAAAH
jgi:hypothetical protein